MDFSVDSATQQRIEKLNDLGREHMRPLGIEADLLGRPTPPEHPYFEKLVGMGYGRTRYTGRKGQDDSPKKSSDKSKAKRMGRSRASLLLSEQMSYWDRGVAVSAPGPGLGEGAIMSMGTEDQKERYLSPFIKLDKPRWGAFAMTEPAAGSDVASIQTRAIKDGNDWVLIGNKSFSGNSSRSDFILVWATVDASLGRAGHRAFLVERGMPGLQDFHIEKKMGLKAYESTSFRLEECRVPAENLLGGEAYYESRAGFKGAMATFNATRPLIAAMAVGIGRSALDESLAFARENQMLDDPRVRDRLERVTRKLRAARLLCLKAAWLADHQQPNIVEASMSKAVAPTAAFEATSLGMELLGMVGARGDHLIEKLFRDVKAMDIVEGTGQIQRVVMARQMLGLPHG
ncbi:MAG: acyl-CoA dehydrogenase family protein [Gammaproteobacteria bacterium]|nr:acyl-CoA dehydrogenase family protein [Gammaproteobacteria bacterium]MBQ0840462.1 acyl-CoA dehydrogenase family protein [Gammaproteobacteria bacterium]